MSRCFVASLLKVSATSIYFESLPYKASAVDGLIDYEKLEEKALEFRPKMIICGGSAYPREWDYARFRAIADKVGALLMCDMAHISGLVVSKEVDQPFEFADIVTSTTHKTLRGPRSGIIFFRRGLKPAGLNVPEGTMYDFENKIDMAVFPALQGGPHNHQIAALTVALKQTMDPSFKVYAKQVKSNAKKVAEFLMSKGYKLVSDGTDNHLVLWDMRPLGISGNKMEKVRELTKQELTKQPPSYTPFLHFQISRRITQRLPFSKTRKTIRGYIINSAKLSSRAHISLIGRST